VTRPDPDAAETYSLDRDRILNHRLRTFKAFNARKLSFIGENLPPRERDLFTLIPLLLHLDDPAFPGFTPGAPAGLHLYFPPDDLGTAVNRLLPDTRVPSGARFGRHHRDAAIVSLAVIGSPGSVAQSRRSDFDYWVIHQGLSDAARLLLEEKVRLIEDWAARRHRTEVHFFVLSVDQVVRNDFGPTEGESVGSAMAMLLKEEFYRTMTLVSGQIPVWWLAAPSCSAEHYQEVVALAARSQLMDPDQLADLGYLGQPGPEEYLGGALWHINKTIGSPFKSVLKLAVLEVYLLDQPELLADTLKRRLWSRHSDQALLLDPYLLMIDRAGQYLEAAGRTGDVELLQACLYLKTGLKITLQDRKNRSLSGRKRHLVQTLERWGWSQHRTGQFNDYGQWSFQQRIQFNERLNRFLLSTYDKLTRSHDRPSPTGPAISRDDLTVLGRRLFRFYEQRENKVQVLPNFLEEPLHIPDLTLFAAGYAPGRQEVAWEIYAGDWDRSRIRNDEAEKSLLKRTRGLAAALAYLVANEMYAPWTSLHLAQPEPLIQVHIAMPDIQAALQKLNEFMPPVRLNPPGREDLLADERSVRTFLLGLDDLDKPAPTVSLIRLTSWGQTLVETVAHQAALDALVSARRRGVPIDYFLPDHPSLGSLAYGVGQVLDQVEEP
jgi:adenylate cyclase class 1